MDDDELREAPDAAAALLSARGRAPTGIMFPVRWQNTRAWPVGLLVALICSSGSLFSGEPAQAATVSVPLNSGLTDGAAPAFRNVAVYIAADGEVNRLTILEEKPGRITLSDSGATITAGEGCSSLDERRVVCDAIETRAFLADRDDEALAQIPAGPIRPFRGALPRPRLQLSGGPGDDRLSVRTPGAGMVGSGGAAIGEGGSRETSVVLGGDGDDVLEGSSAADLLLGGPGRDRISGGDGDDLLAGGRGDDVLFGEAGADFLLGGDQDAFESGSAQPPDRDVLDGGPGTDLLAGGPGRDQLRGGTGRDTVLYDRPLVAANREPSPVRVSFDGVANDGPRRERDNVGRAGVEAVISVGSGLFSVAGSLRFADGVYSVTGGSQATAILTRLTQRGTAGAQSGRFSGSSFDVSASALLTEIRLTGVDRSVCRSTRAVRLGAAPGYAPVRRSTGSRVLRRLRAKARGRFRTRGRSSAATVRGTRWTTIERCDGTLTEVQEGVVAVRDFRRNRTVLVRAGQSYLAANSTV